MSLFWSLPNRSAAPGGAVEVGKVLSSQLLQCWGLSVTTVAAPTKGTGDTSSWRAAREAVGGQCLRAAGLGGFQGGDSCFILNEEQPL